MHVLLVRRAAVADALGNVSMPHNAPKVDCEDLAHCHTSQVKLYSAHTKEAVHKH
jgi:hypothetical protein